MKRNPYYLVWSDAINRLRFVNPTSNSWKFYSMLFITVAMAMNLAILVTIIERHVLKIDAYHLDFQHYIGVKLNTVLNFTIKFFLPPFVLNYFLIFRRKRYEIITKQYKSYNGKLAVTYIILSLFLPVILIIVAFLVSKIIG